LPAQRTTGEKTTYLLFRARIRDPYPCQEPSS
jgi:hypothetical protein